MLLDLPVEVLQCIYVLAAVRDPESAAALQATCFRMYALTSTAPVLRDIARHKSLDDLGHCWRKLLRLRRLAFHAPKLLTLVEFHRLHPVRFGVFSLFIEGASGVGRRNCRMHTTGTRRSEGPPIRSSSRSSHCSLTRRTKPYVSRRVAMQLTLPQTQLDPAAEDREEDVVASQKALFRGDQAALCPGEAGAAAGDPS